MADEYPIEKEKDTIAIEFSSGTTSEALHRRSTLRCRMCKKKIKLIFYEGRYKKAFCLQNREREDHHCTFDVLGKGAEVLSKEIPHVVADR